MFETYRAVATVADAQAGVNNSKILTPAAMAAALGFSKYYDSGEQVIVAGGTLNLTHGLPTKPKLFTLSLICKTAELGYSVNDETVIVLHHELTSPGVASGIALVPSASAIAVKYSSFTNVFTPMTKNTGVISSININNWRLRLQAWG